MKKVWSKITAAQEDFFMKKATSTLPAGVNDIGLPGSLRELKLIEVTTSGFTDVTFTPLDMSDPEFRRALREGQNTVCREYYFDIVGRNTLKVAPALGMTYDVTLHYVSKLIKAQEYSVGTVNVVANDAAVVGVNTVWLGNAYREWELIVGRIIDPNYVYPALYLDPTSNTSLMLNAGYGAATASNQPYILSSPIDLDDDTRLAVEAYATALAFAKGTNINANKASFWLGIFNDYMLTILEGIEKRQIQDPEFIRAYDPWD